MRDTSMGGRRENFPSTIWSDILSARDPNNPSSKDYWNRLIQSYWKPVYVVIRATWNKSVEDTKDLTQAFFSNLLERNALAKVSKECGSFRSYLRASLKNFLIDAARRQSVRRPSTKLLSLEGNFEDLDRVGLQSGETPDQLFDRQWFQTVFDAAILDLKTKLERENKSSYFDVFNMYCLEGGKSEDDAHAEQPRTPGPSAITYSDVAARFGLKESDVRNHLTYCRNALRGILRARIQDYVVSEGDIDEELRRVLGG